MSGAEVTVTPIGGSSVGARSAARRRDLAMPLGLALLAWALSQALTFFVWRSARTHEEEERNAEFESRVSDTETSIARRLRTHEEVLRGAAGLFAASAVQRQSFHSYVSALELNRSYPGTLGVAFAQRVHAGGLDAYVGAVRAEGFGDFQVWPAGARAEYAPVHYVEPFEGRNRQAVGFDLLTDPVRREALELARDSGQPALSGKVTLVQTSPEDVQAGTLLVLPVYRAEARALGLAGRREALVGWVYSPFLMRDLMQAILGEHADLDLQLFDGEKRRAEDLLYSAHETSGGDGLRAARALQIGGRRWTMVVRSAPQTAAARSTVLGVAGSSLGTVAALLIWLLAASRARALDALEQKRRAAEAIELAHRSTQATLDAMPEPICVLDAQGVIVSVNRSWLRFAAARGVSGPFEGRKYLEMWQPDEEALRGFAPRLELVLAGEQDAASFEYQCHAWEQPRWFVVHAARFEDQAQPRVVVVQHDVSQQILSAEKLRESEERLRGALAAARQVAWDHDTTDPGSLPAAWRQLTGVEPTRAHALDAVHADDRSAVRRALADCLQGRAETLGVEFRLRSPSGAWRWMRMQGEVAPDKPGTPRRVAGTLTDIDELHALQEHMLRTTRLASVDTLAAGVAHEINNPLAWVHADLTLGLETLEQRPFDERMRTDLIELLKEALTGTTRIATIVKALRSLARAEHGGAPQIIDVRSELLDAVQLVRNQVEQRATLEVDVPPTLPGVRAHASELGLVFLNLLVNASQSFEERAGAGERVCLAARVEKGALVVEVSDTGCGIPGSVLDRIFEPFVTTRPVGRGSGLGLAIAHSIVEQTGGEIRVESAEGKGTTVRVSLPIADESLAAPTAQKGSAPARRRVLVVDDEALVARSLERRLERVHEVTVLHSGEEALRRLERGERWDALLFDLMMPGFDAQRMHEALEKEHPDLLARLGFLTGGAFGERASAFLRAHPELVVLPRPIATAHLLEVVEHLARGEAH